MVSQFDRLGDRYEIKQIIGRGGMAEVHEGLDTRLNRRVAIKVLRADLARDPIFQERFRREAQSAAGLNHPNIVSIYDTGEDSYTEGLTQTNVPYIVMEYVDGVTLREMLQNGPRILPERGLEILAGVLAALDYAHRHGIVHRDIKPANVMINTHGDAKVMDFGIARAMSDAATSVTATSAVMGTAQYLSPEQARGEVADARSDIYAAGCLLYELLTGATPFTGDSPVSIAYQHVNSQVVPPSHLDPSIPPTLDAIVLQALAKNPMTRYQTAAEMRADVERAIAGMPISAAADTQVFATSAPTTAIPIVQAEQPIDPVESAKTRKRSKKFRIGGAVVGLTAAVGAVFFLASLLFGGGGGNNATVPDLRGKTVAEAQLALESVGLTIGTQTPTADEEAIKGTIVGQDPTAGESLEQGQAVNVKVSSGKGETLVPDLIDLSSTNDARAVLSASNLVLGKIIQKDSDKPEGTILEQNPIAGSSVEAGSRVDVAISSGKVTVPNVLGMNRTDAYTILLTAGFTVQFIEEPRSDIAAGTVLAQMPLPGEVTVKGTIVVLNVAAAAPAPAVTVTVTPTPSPSTTTP